MIRRGKNRKVSKNASSVKVFIINRFPLPYVTFSKTGSQMLDSSTKTCKKRKGKRRKWQVPKTVPKPRKKKKKTEKTLGSYILYQNLKQNAFFFVCFLRVLSFVVPLNYFWTINYLVPVISLFLNYWIDINFVTARGSSAKFFQDGMVAFVVLDKAGRDGVLPNISYQKVIPYGSWLIFKFSRGTCMPMWNVL